MSSRCLRLVVPTMGALTTRHRVSQRSRQWGRRRDVPSFERLHAIEICAMLTPFFFASSSTLRVGTRISIRTHRILLHAPLDDLRGARVVHIRLHEPTSSYSVSSLKAQTGGQVEGATYWSTWLRFVWSESGRVRTPRATGDHGIEPTPNI